jgi:uncharacterized membrane protein YraQ (UPF0718 family)
MDKKLLIKTGLIIGTILLIIDEIYKSYKNINYLSREKCFIYTTFPKPLRLFVEYYLELFIILLIGIFVAVLLERAYLNYKQFFPKNPVQAFIYGSLLPICSCGAIPLIGAFKDKVNLRTIITFILAAPLLSPYIIMLSWTTIGVKFAALRIISSFILAISAGYVVEYFAKKDNFDLPNVKICTKFLQEKDIYLKTYEILKAIFPYFILAATLGVVFDIFSLQKFFMGLDLSNPYIGLLISILIGIPLFLCNGAEVLVLRPFISHGFIPLGTAIAFAMTSTAICVTSIVLTASYLGKRLTAVLVTYIFIATFTLGLIINILFS